MADNQENYYVDTHGSMMPESRYVANLIVATGAISRKYAQSTLTRVASQILKNPFWKDQIVQINIRKFYLYGLNKAGWNKYNYISVEFSNQIICKKNKRKK